MNVFKENLKKYRIVAGYKTAKDFAKVLGIPYPRYASYECNGREPKFEVLCQIARKLNVSIDNLLGYKVIDSNKYEENKFKKKMLELRQLTKDIERFLDEN